MCNGSVMSRLLRSMYVRIYVNVSVMIGLFIILPLQFVTVAPLL